MRIKISNVDRCGLVFDISRLLLQKNINIISMEVTINVIYFEIPDLGEAEEKEVFSLIKSIENITEITRIPLMPHEEKVRRLKVVLDTVNEGILSIDENGNVIQYNQAAEKILHISSKEAVGKSLMEVFPCCLALMEALRNGNTCLNKEVFFEKTGSHYLVSTYPVIDDEGKIIGGVASLKDIHDVRRIYQKLTEQPKVSFAQILHKSEEMKRVIALAKRYARGNSTILIRGETGTGKELFARALHDASPRTKNIFVTINCAAIPDTLLESELFGYEEGAFTGASKGGKQGLFELANDGTLFLDEVGEISAHLQAKLLRVLQEHKVRRIGGRREIPLDVRLLAATHRPLEKMIEDGDFREDLYYRLNVIPLYLPPLRSRKEDIALLAQSFLDRFLAKLNRPSAIISPDSLVKLINYSWPGNIRELENIIERAINEIKGNIILPENIIFNRHRHQDEKNLPDNLLKFSDRTLAEIMDETEKQVLCRALSKYQTSRKLGGALGISHTSVIKKMHKYGLQFSKDEVE